MLAIKPTLYYVYDPMCSWCWGYKPAWLQIKEAVIDDVEVVYVLGGLAPDSDVPMSEAMQQQIATYWKKIENDLGTQFNYDFWYQNTPRRSTYPACRAILAAREQRAEPAMLDAIQHAYYLDAKNPSDNDILIGLAKSIGIDCDKFEADFLSPTTHDALLREIAFARSIGGNSFPSLFVQTEKGVGELMINYEDAKMTIAQIRSVI
ncbi:DsbA family protein [Photobacterium profundum]|uniref:DsbA family protein n=1 Tax=Photobacterium profundum TaxID=74109 RepID=UPI003D0DEEC1